MGVTCVSVEGSGVTCVSVEGSGVTCVSVEGSGVTYVSVEGSGVTCVSVEGSGVGSASEDACVAIAPVSTPAFSANVIPPANMHSTSASANARNPQFFFISLSSLSYVCQTSGILA